MKVSLEYILKAQKELETMPVSYGFESISIVQEKNKCLSRLDANINSEIFRDTFRPVPLIASNMSTVVNSDFCIKLFKAGALGIMHRAAPDDVLVSEINKIAKECDIVVASIGIGSGQYELAESLIKAGATGICIDVAHGYSDVVIELGRKIKKNYKDVKLIIGNTVNPNMVLEVCDFADALKVGIGQGAACTTKNTAGSTEKQFSAVYKFRYLAKEYGLPIISDGGIREPGDFTKAIASGANSVMMGSKFAACPESAAPLVEVKGDNKFIPGADPHIINYKKLYAGMASEYTQKQWKGGLKPGTIAEGKVVYLDLGDPVEKVIEAYSGALKSGITYAGAQDIKELHDNVKFIRLV